MTCLLLPMNQLSISDVSLTSWRLLWCLKTRWWTCSATSVDIQVKRRKRMLKQVRQRQLFRITLRHSLLMQSKTLMNMIPKPKQASQSTGELRKHWCSQLVQLGSRFGSKKTWKLRWNKCLWSISCQSWPVVSHSWGWELVKYMVSMATLNS